MGLTDDVIRVQQRLADFLDGNGADRSTLGRRLDERQRGRRRGNGRPKLGMASRSDVRLASVGRPLEDLGVRL